MDTNELDARIAEQVMGLRVDSCGYWYDDTGPHYLVREQDQYGDFAVWNPSGDSPESWRQFGLVLERVCRDVNYLEVAFSMPETRARVIARGIGWWNDKASSGDSILEAACKAILEAWNA